MGENEESDVVKGTGKWKRDQTARDGSQRMRHGEGHRGK